MSWGVTGLGGQICFRALGVSTGEFKILDRALITSLRLILDTFPGREWSSLPMDAGHAWVQCILNVRGQKSRWQSDREFGGQAREYLPPEDLDLLLSPGTYC
jgi:hypothetical protein